MKRSYNVPLRASFRQTERYNKSKRAVSALQAFMRRHMKSDDVKLGASVNEAIWSRGGKNPPHHVKVVCEKNDEGVVYVELEGQKLPSEIAAEEEKKEKKKEEKNATKKTADEKKEDKKPATTESTSSTKPAEEKTPKSQKPAKKTSSTNNKKDTKE